MLHTIATRKYHGVWIVSDIEGGSITRYYMSGIMTNFMAILVRNGSELAANRDVLRLARLREASDLDALAEQQAVG
jgi:hypothetical protein